MITKHNDFDGLEQLKSKSAAELRAIVSAGLIQIGSFDTEKVAGQQDIVLSPDFTVGWSHPNDIRAKGFKVDYSRYRHAPRSFARIFTKSREGSLALREGMVQYAIQKGLTPDAAYNWSRIFDAARFILIDALVELQNNTDLQQYIKSVPLIGSPDQFKNWSYNAPTSNPDFGILDQRSIVNLSSIASKVLRARLSAEECFELRQDNLEAKAKRTGQPFTRAVFQEFKPNDRGFKKPYQQRDNQQQPSAKPASTKFDSFRSSVESDIPKPVERESRGHERHTTILSCMPTHEENESRKRNKKFGNKNKSQQKRNDYRWN